MGERGSPLITPPPPHQPLRFYTTSAAEYNAALAEFGLFKNAHHQEFLPHGATHVVGTSSKVWWQLHGAPWPSLQKVALRIFSVATSSLSSERNFSTFAHVWNKKSNSLSFDTANKLVFCWHNIRALQQLHSGTAPRATVEAEWLEEEIEE
jgi:hypothetical protein